MDIIAKIIKATADAESNIDKASAEYHAPLLTEERPEFYALKLQAAIVQFELCAQMKLLLESTHSVFVRKMIVKSVIHTLYEYDKTFRNKHLVRINELACRRCLDALVVRRKAATRTWRKELKKIDRFKNIRDKTSGHYDPNIAEQVKCIESIEENDAFAAFKVFLSYNSIVLKMLGDIGANINADNRL